MQTKDLIKSHRTQKGLSQKDLAELVGVSEATVCRWESGNIANMRRDRIAKLASALSISPMLIMGTRHDDPECAIPIPKMRRIPVLGSIRAGVPVLAEENIEGYSYADVPDGQEYYFLRVKGDSMINARIHDGDLVLIKQQPCADDGQVVACLVNGAEATLKRFYRQKDMIILKPENPAYSPIIVPCSDFDSGYARILGVVKEVKFKL